MHTRKERKKHLHRYHHSFIQDTFKNNKLQMSVNI